jgi:hypothetical protein
MLVFCRGLPRKFNLSNFGTAPGLRGIYEIRFECLQGAKKMRIKCRRTAWEEAGGSRTGISLSVGQDRSCYKV